MAEEQLQEDQWWEAAFNATLIERFAPGFRSGQATLLEDHAQTATVEIQLDVTCVARYCRSCQTLFQYRSDMHEEAGHIFHAYIPGIRRVGLESQFVAQYLIDGMVASQHEVEHAQCRGIGLHGFYGQSIG